MDSTYNGLVRGGFYLFLDLIVVNLGGWAFWFTVSKLTTPVEVGYATTAISLAGLLGGFFGLGLDYSLLREVATGRRSAFGTALTFEMSTLTLLSPALFATGLLIYGANFTQYMVLSIPIFLASGLVLVTRSTALALLEARRVFLYDAAGTALRFTVGVWLVLMGLGGIGILAGGIAGGLVIGLTLLRLCHIRLGLINGGLKELIHLLKLGLSNFPGKVAGLIIGNLSIVMLAAYTLDPAGVGRFFIALAISLVAGGLATSLAIIALPLSVQRGSDASQTSLRLGISLTSPLIAGLVAAPELILSLIGPAYTTASDSLRILALAMIPSIIYSNAVTKLNHTKDLKRLTALGATQLITFLVTFVFLANTNDAWGVALSILISNTSVGIPSLTWLGRQAARPTAASIAAVAVGWALPTILSLTYQPIIFALAASASLATIFTIRAITPKELIQLAKEVITSK